MTERTIRVTEDTWQALQARSPDGETLDETISRLIEVERRSTDREWDDEKIDEAVHEMKSELESDFDEDA